MSMRDENRQRSRWRAALYLKQPLGFEMTVVADAADVAVANAHEARRASSGIRKQAAALRREAKRLRMRLTILPTTAWQSRALHRPAAAYSASIAELRPRE
jgi:hypothetical protein